MGESSKGEVRLENRIVCCYDTHSKTILRRMLETTSGILLFCLRVMGNQQRIYTGKDDKTLYLEDWTEAKVSGMGKIRDACIIQ